jgi:hypothetical protein
MSHDDVEALRKRLADNGVSVPKVIPNSFGARGLAPETSTSEILTTTSSRRGSTTRFQGKAAAVMNSFTHDWSVRHVGVHKHSSNHRAELNRSATCGGFFCLAIFPPSRIAGWIDDDGVSMTALCPQCGIDSVNGAASGFPIKLTLLEPGHGHGADRRCDHTGTRRAERNHWTVTGTSMRQPRLLTEARTPALPTHEL